MKKRIIVPTDLTETADHAIRQAVLIAKKNDSSILLLHVLVDPGDPDEEAKRGLLEEKARQVHMESGLDCDILIRTGSIFDAIPYVSCEHDFDLMVIGTHGIHGFRQKMLGSDILKLVEKISIPVLVVQPDSILKNSFENLVLPVSSHDNFPAVVDAAILFAKLFGSSVCLYSVIKAGFDWPEKLLTNIEYATRKFEEEGVAMHRVKEDQNVYSIGFAKQTINYSHSVNADAICIITPSSKEFYYFAPSDKEALLLNESRIPVLCAGGINL